MYAFQPCGTMEIYHHDHLWDVLGRGLSRYIPNGSIIDVIVYRVIWNWTDWLAIEGPRDDSCCISWWYPVILLATMRKELSFRVYVWDVSIPMRVGYEHNEHMIPLWNDAGMFGWDIANGMYHPNHRLKNCYNIITRDLWISHPWVVPDRNVLPRLVRWWLTIKIKGRLWCTVTSFYARGIRSATLWYLATSCQSV
jgi:hypothetical protein